MGTTQNGRVMAWNAPQFAVTSQFKEEYFQSSQPHFAPHRPVLPVNNTPRSGRKAGKHGCMRKSERWRSMANLFQDATAYDACNCQGALDTSSSFSPRCHGVEAWNPKSLSKVHRLAVSIRLMSWLCRILDS